VKTSKRKGNRTKPIQHRRPYEISSATGCAVFLMASSGAAFAQAQPPGAQGASDGSQMEEVIVKPSTVTDGGFSPFGFEEHLVNRIINDAGDRLDQLPLMQHALINAHPLTNDATTQIGRDDLVRFLRATGHEPAILKVSE